MLVIERTPMIRQNLWPHVPLPIPLEQLDIRPRRALARKHKRRRPIAHDQRLALAVKVRANAGNPLALVGERD